MLRALVRHNSPDAPGANNHYFSHIKISFFIPKYPPIPMKSPKNRQPLPSLHFHRAEAEAEESALSLLFSDEAEAE